MVLAKQDELEALNRNNTCHFTSLSQDKTIIGCQWAYRIKYHANGIVDRLKARLVANGYA